MQAAKQLHCRNCTLRVASMRVRVVCATHVPMKAKERKAAAAKQAKEEKAAAAAKAKKEKEEARSCF